MKIYTVGHSTHSIEVFVGILKSFDVEAIGDVRGYPASKRYPHFNKVNLSRFLTRSGISYTHLKGLGGFRKPKLNTPNTYFKSETFRGYADHMRSEEFESELQNLFELASYNRTALMCAESSPENCHRKLIADMLATRDVEVIHILDVDESKPHRLSDHVVIRDGVLIYPAAEDQQMGLF